jgi:hypothetical protein
MRGHGRAHCTLREIIPQCSWLSTLTASMEPKRMADKMHHKESKFEGMEIINSNQLYTYI